MERRRKRRERPGKFEKVVQAEDLGNVLDGEEQSNSIRTRYAIKYWRINPFMKTNKNVPHLIGNKNSRQTEETAIRRTVLISL